MQEVTRNSYSLYKRETGSRTIWYVRFRDDETQSYTGGRSTGQTAKPAANRQVQKWLAEGLPKAQGKDFKATRNRLVRAIAKYRLEWPDERSKTAAIPASVSGMRISEIMGLRIDELDMEHQVIHVQHSFSAYEKRLKGTKNEKSRFIYTDASILNLLSELHQKNPWQNSFIFWGSLSKLPSTMNGEALPRLWRQKWILRPMK